MHPIFFAWIGTYDALVATGFYSHGFSTRTVAIRHGAAYAGVIAAQTPAVRAPLATLHPNFCLMPGPNGTINTAQAAAINAIAPGLNVKGGDAFASTLSHVYSLYGDEAFNPSNY
jgi:hypothetical protein